MDKYIRSVHSPLERTPTNQQYKFYDNFKQYFVLNVSFRNVFLTLFEVVHQGPIKKHSLRRQVFNPVGVKKQFFSYEFLQRAE